VRFVVEVFLPFGREWVPTMAFVTEEEADGVAEALRVRRSRLGGSWSDVRVVDLEAKEVKP
jgi:hypothetical protein